MHLKQKIVLVFAVLFIVATAVLCSLLYFTAVSTFAEIERFEMGDNLSRLENTFSNRLDNLAGKVGDWAVWDDAYFYILGENPEFPDNEVVPGYFSVLGVNIVAHLDLQGNILHVRALRDFSSDEFDDDLADQFARELGPKIASQDGSAPWAYVMSMSDLPPILIASAPVIQSSGLGPSSGTVVFAQFFDTEAVRGLSSDLLYEISSAQVGMPDMAPDFSDAYEFLAAGETKVMQPSFVDTLSGYILVKDAEGHAVMVMRLDMPRNTFLYGRRITISLALSLLAIMTLTLLMLYIIVGRLVVGRIEKLNSAVQDMATGTRPKLAISGRDEITFLAQEISRTIARLDESTAVAAAHAAELRKYKQAMEQVSDMIIITDPNFKIIFANQGAETLSGYSHDELIGRDALSLWTGDDALGEAIRKSLVGHRVNISQEVTSPKKNGEKYIAELHLSSLNDESGRLLHLVGVSYDITKAKEIERMKTEFVSVASHQLKTPLTDIRWITEMLMEEKGGLSEEQREYLGQILLVNDRLIRLVNDLLNVSRIETGRKFDIVKESTDLMAIIERATVDQSIAAHQKDVKISMGKGTPNSLTVNIDQEKIYQVLHNLINNAVKYSLEGSEVTVDIDDGVEDVTVSVHDQGIGIPESDRNKIFNKFFRAQNVGEVEGTGLGLYIVKAIVEGHGGKIWFESVEGKGTIFRFTVPKG